MTIMDSSYVPCSSSGYIPFSAIVKKIFEVYRKLGTGLCFLDQLRQLKALSAMFAQNDVHMEFFFPCRLELRTVL